MTVSTLAISRILELHHPLSILFKCPFIVQCSLFYMLTRVCKPYLSTIQFNNPPCLISEFL